MWRQGYGCTVRYPGGGWCSSPEQFDADPQPLILLGAGGRHGPRHPDLRRKRVALPLLRSRVAIPWTQGPRLAGGGQFPMPRVRIEQNAGHMVPVIEVFEPGLGNRDGLGGLKPLPGQVHGGRVLRVEEEDTGVVEFGHRAGAAREDGSPVS